MTDIDYSNMTDGEDETFSLQLGNYDFVASDFIWRRRIPLNLTEDDIQRAIFEFKKYVRIFPHKAWGLDFKEERVCYYNPIKKSVSIYTHLVFFNKEDLLDLPLKNAYEILNNF